MARPALRALPFAAALLLFALSGAGALVVETIWLRWLRGLLGATAPAASATLVAFFLGQALGAAAAARFAPRSARPLALYGGLELAAALWALAVPSLLGVGEAALAAVYDDVRGSPGLLTALRFAAALLATLPASLAFGASLPALAAAALGGPSALGRRGAALYGTNTAGAALGAALASFWLPEALGVGGAYACGAAALAAAGAGALGLSLRFAPVPATRAAELAPAARRGGAPARRAPRLPAAAPETHGVRAPARRTLSFPVLAILAALSGFGVFAAEVLFVQSFALVLDQSVYAFGAVLVVVLVALAVSALAVAASQRAGAAAEALLAGGLAAAALGLAAFPALFFAATGGLTFLASERPWPAYLGAALATAAGTAGPVLLAAGVVFPACVAAAGAAGSGGAAAARLGRLAAVNTLGALAGALAAPWLLLPQLGVWRAFGALALLYAAAALAVPTGRRGLRAGVAATLAVGLGGVLALAPPGGVPPVRLAPGERLVSHEFTAAGLVAVVERGPGDLLIQTDNHYALGGSAEASHEARQAHVALLLRPGARRVAWIGSATGISPGAALLHPLERLTLVELVPGVARAARAHFARWNRGVYADPRSEVVLDDGRNFVRATGERFDVLVADLFVPWQAGAAGLYAREHFAAARARLSEGGLFCQWLPLYQLGEADVRVLLATFLDVFPAAVLFRGDFYGRFPIVALVGYAGAAPGADAISAAAARLAAHGVADRWVTHPVGFWSLYMGPLAPVAPSLAPEPRNTDDHPRLEFLAARSRAGGALARDGAFTGLRLAGFSRQLAAGLAEPDPVFGPLGAARLRAAAGGHALQSADALYGAGRSSESARARAAAAARLPAELLADAGPDPSAVRVWHAGEGAAGSPRPAGPGGD